MKSVITYNIYTLSCAASDCLGICLSKCLHQWTYFRIGRAIFFFLDWMCWTTLKELNIDNKVLIHALTNTVPVASFSELTFWPDYFSWTMKVTEHLNKTCDCHWRVSDVYWCLLLKYFIIRTSVLCTLSAEISAINVNGSYSHELPLS